MEKKEKTIIQAISTNVDGYYTDLAEGNLATTEENEESTLSEATGLEVTKGEIEYLIQKGLIERRSIQMRNPENEQSVIWVDTLSVPEADEYYTD
jgi:hypothetical protein